MDLVRENSHRVLLSRRRTTAMEIRSFSSGRMLNNTTYVFFSVTGTTRGQTQLISAPSVYATPYCDVDTRDLPVKSAV
jgi:hypothetical protein